MQNGICLDISHEKSCSSTVNKKLICLTKKIVNEFLQKMGFLLRNLSFLHRTCEIARTNDGEKKKKKKKKKTN